MNVHERINVFRVGCVVVFTALLYFSAVLFVISLGGG